MPDRTWTREGSANIRRNGPAEFLRPAADRLVGNIDPALGKNLLHIPQTQREFEGQPDGLADNFRREAVSFIRDGLHPAILYERQVAVSLTTPRLD